MKQKISWDQLSMLEFHQFKDWELYENVDEIYKIKTQDLWDMLKISDDVQHTVDKSTIGVCIEYIEDYSFEFDIKRGCVNGEEWVVYGVDYNDEVYNFSNTELIDALWEAVIYIMDEVVDWSEE